MNKSGLKITNVEHTKLERVIIPISALIRGVLNQVRLKKLSRESGLPPVSHDLRSGRK